MHENLITDAANAGYKSPSLRLIHIIFEKSFLQSNPPGHIDDERCYVVLWIPVSLFHSSFERPGRTQVEKNISDIPNDELFIRVEFIDGGDFSVAVRNDNEYKQVVLLHREQVGPNSLIEFSYESTPEEDGFCFTKTVFPVVVYKILYEMYCPDLISNDVQNITFCPYVSGQRVELYSKDNEAIRYYLQQYSTIISYTVVYLQSAINAITKRHRELGIKERSLINEMCNEIRRLELSLGGLARSRYNTVCRADSDDDEGAQIAWTIEHGLYSVKYLEQQWKQQIQNEFIDSSSRSAQKSIALGWASVGIGLLSVLAAIFIAQNSSHELQTVRDELEKELFSIPSGFPLINLKIDSLSLETNKEDTLLLKKSEIKEAAVSQDTTQSDR